MQATLTFEPATTTDQNTYKTSTSTHIHLHQHHNCMVTNTHLYTHQHTSIYTYINTYGHTCRNTNTHLHTPTSTPPLLHQHHTNTIPTLHKHPLTHMLYTQIYTYINTSRLAYHNSIQLISQKTGNVS